MRNVEVNFDVLKGWEQQEEELSNVFSFIVTDDPSAALENYKYTITEIANIFGHGHWHVIDDMFKKIKAETGFNIKEDGNKYHIEVGNIRRYSEHTIDLLKKMKQGIPTSEIDL